MRLDGRCVPLDPAAAFLIDLNHFYDRAASEEEVMINRMLDKVLRRSDAIDKESLCILAGHRVRGPTPSFVISIYPRLGLASTHNIPFPLRCWQYA